MTQAAIPQFSYHQWPEGEPPALRFKASGLSPTKLARQLSPYYDVPSPSFSSFPDVARKEVVVPLPFVWDSVNQDYFCYEPETTCYIYAKLGRILYDSVKKEHYRPDALQRLTYAKTYPEHRVYQSGELMFWDPRRREWYQYDMQARRILWRDQKWWPFPHKFEPPSLNSPPRSPAPSNTKQPSQSAFGHVQPVEPQPRIVQVSPFDTPTTVTGRRTGDKLPKVLETKEVDLKHHRRPKQKDKFIHNDVLEWSGDKGVVYEVPSRDPAHKSRKSRGGMYDLQDLVDKSMRKRRKYSWF